MSDRQLSMPWGGPVHVRAYHRIRFGKTESVRSHFRSLPGTKRYRD